jgi:hypothetical protein
MLLPGVNLKGERKMRFLPFLILLLGIIAPVRAQDSSVLSWEAPLTRADGTVLSPAEIGGFRVYHGTISDNLTLLADLNNSSALTYTHTNPGFGSHFYAVTTYDTVGNESTFSNIVSKTFLAAPSSITITIQ